MSKLIPVPFQQDHLAIINLNSEPYIPMRPIVENLGLSWSRQVKKLTKVNRGLKATVDKFGCQDILTISADGKKREMLCIPLKKLNGWLFSINPEKVKPKIKDKVISYQDECFTVLNDYWKDGIAINPRAKAKPEKTRKALPGCLTLEQQDAVKEHHKKLMELANVQDVDKRAKLSIALWSAPKSKFGVSYKEVPTENFEDVISLMTRVAVEGEWLPKEQKGKYHYPAETAMPFKNISNHQAWFDPDNIADNRSGHPTVDLLKQMEADGCNVDGPKIEIDALYHQMEVMMELAPLVNRLSNFLNSVMIRGMNVKWNRDGTYHYLGADSKFEKKW